MAYQRLNYEDIIHISIRFKVQRSLQTIVFELDRSIGTISREIKCGCIIEGCDFVYSAAADHQRASEQAQLSHRKFLILEQDGLLNWSSKISGNAGLQRR